MQIAIDGVDQARLACQPVDRPDAADADPARPLGQFVVDIAGGQHRLLPRRPDPRPQSVRDAAFAIDENPVALTALALSALALNPLGVFTDIHSKCHRAVLDLLLPKHCTSSGISSAFFKEPANKSAESRLIGG